MDRQGPRQRRVAKDGSGDLAVALLKGAVAGLVATWVLDRVDWFLYEHEPEHSRRRTWAVRPEHKDPAHYIASRASQALGGPPIPQGHPAGLAVHYAIGVAPAAVYGVVREQIPAARAGSGLAFGMAMFVLQDEIANPAMGVAAPPLHYPWQPHARGLISHLVYGLTAELVLNAFDAASQDPARHRRRRRGVSAPRRHRSGSTLPHIPRMSAREDLPAF